MSSLKNELYGASNGDFRTRLNIIFKTSSPKKVDDLDPAKLPIVPTSLDMWVLRDQSIVLTMNWETNDEVINMNFTGFTAEILKTFSQTLVPTSKPYNQGLVVIDKVLQFVSMDSAMNF